MPTADPNHGLVLTYDSDPVIAQLEQRINSLEQQLKDLQQQQQQQGNL